MTLRRTAGFQLTAHVEPEEEEQEGVANVEKSFSTFSLPHSGHAILSSDERISNLNSSPQSPHSYLKIGISVFRFLHKLNFCCPREKITCQNPIINTYFSVEYRRFLSLSRSLIDWCMVSHKPPGLQSGMDYLYPVVELHQYFPVF